MPKSRDLHDSLSPAELRRLLTLRDSLDKVTKLMEKRERLLGELRLIEEQVSEILSGTSTPRAPIRALCEEVLRRKRRPLTPAEVKDAILKKCPGRNSRTFYNQVFIALSRNTAFRRMADGRFRLRKSRKQG